MEKIEGYHDCFVKERLRQFYDQLIAVVQWCIEHSLLQLQSVVISETNMDDGSPLLCEET